jgi:hypothetical protein
VPVPLPAATFAALQHSLEKRWIRLLLLLVCGVFARLPALQGELIWDDQLLVRDNPLIKSPLLIFETFRHHLLLDSFSAHYRPVQNISYAIDYFFWNTGWHGFHMSSVLWHVAGGMLLYLLLETLLKRLASELSTDGASADKNRITSAAAFLVALLWVVHPVHSAAVDYMSGRADSLAFFFGCAAWLLYLRARTTARRPWQIGTYVLAAFSLLLALGSRESACMWVAIFTLHLICFERALTLRAKAAVLGASLVVLLGYGVLRQLPEARATPNPSHGWSASFRGVLMLRALGDYGRLMVFPSNLHMERSLIDGAQVRSHRSWREAVSVEYLSLGGLLVAGALLAGSLRKGAAQPCALSVQHGSSGVTCRSRMSWN